MLLKHAKSRRNWFGEFMNDGYECPNSTMRSNTSPKEKMKHIYALSRNLVQNTPAEFDSLD